MYGFDNRYRLIGHIWKWKDNMADWNLSFDYVACFLLLLIVIWYLSEKIIPLKSHKAFFCLVAVIFVATATEIAATLMARLFPAFSYKIFFFVLSIQGLAINLVPMALAYYIFFLVHMDMGRKKSVKYLFVAGLAADVVVIVVNFFTEWAFTFENGRYQNGYGGLILYGIDAVMIIISLVLIVRHATNFVFLRTPALLFNVVCGIVCCLIQLFLYVPMLNLSLALLCLMFYYYLQNPGTVTEPVTRQFNRMFMGEYLYGKFSEGKDFGVIAVAMDDFKFINKTYGVENGDNLLFQVGSFLDTLKANTTVFRFGSDQFCVAVTKNLENIGNLAETIQARFKHPWYSESQVGIMMSASLCCIECPRDAATYGELVEVLDYSMSMVKKTNKGKVMFANDINLDRVKQDKTVEKAVKQAMDRDELLVYYQPIYSVNKGVYNSAEALVRMHDEELGWVSPEIFIPIAEKNGLIIEMGEMILNKVCSFIHDYKLSETSIEYIEVNTSPVQLMQHDFSDRVKDILEKYDVSPEQINIEITETATLTSSSVVTGNIKKLVDYGISFSLDDYGSGYANIDYINHMPFKIIKLDKYFIWDSFKNDKAGITLEYTIGMLNALQLYIVAEGVETEEMRDYLVNIGCHYMQGWYYSKAIADTEFMELIADR